MKHLMYESYVVDENYNIVQLTPLTGKNIQELNIYLNLYFQYISSKFLYPASCSLEDQ